ncbi:MAG: uncharacterized protein JWQ98_400 [Chlorobi bacterium]|nr:uncharacterized protein [Chlorobiota bacterium]
MIALDSKQLRHIILGIALIAGVFFFRFTADDGYITARYAEHLVDTGALVFNSGERVSALTSPLHAIVEAGLYAVTGQTIIAYKLLAALLLLTAGFVLTSRFPDHRIVVPLTCLSPQVLLWTFGGLETPILLLLIALFAITAHAGGASDRRRLLLLSVIAGIAFITRFDSALFTAPVLIHAALKNRRAGEIARAIGIGAVIPVAWIAFAALYYGDVFPTSFYVKTPTLHGERMLECAVNIIEFLLFTGFLPLMIGGVLIARRYLPDALRDHLRRVLPLLVGLGAIIAYGQLTGMIHMMFSFRMFVPYVPALAVIICDLLGRLREPIATIMASPRGRVIITSLLLLAIAFQGTESWVIYSRSLNGVSIVGEYRHIGIAGYMDDFIPALFAGGDDIASHWKSTADSGRAPRVMTFAAGALPYRYRAAYIFEPLVSYRRSCKATGAESADYIHLLVATLDEAAALLPKPIGHYQMVSYRTIIFDGAPRSFIVLYDPDPGCNPLPPTVNGPCADCTDEHTVGNEIRYDR